METPICQRNMSIFKTPAARSHQDIYSGWCPHFPWNIWVTGELFFQVGGSQRWRHQSGSKVCIGLFIRVMCMCIYIYTYYLYTYNYICKYIYIYTYCTWNIRILNAPTRFASRYMMVHVGGKFIILNIGWFNTKNYHHFLVPLEIIERCDSLKIWTSPKITLVCHQHVSHVQFPESQSKMTIEIPRRCPNLGVSSILFETTPTCWTGPNPSPSPQTAELPQALPPSQVTR